MSNRKRFPPAVYRMIRLRQNQLCACGCGEPLEADHVHYDHILPLHLGGEDSPENIRAMNDRHHLKKTIAEAKARGKVRRIIKKRRPRLNAQERALARIKAWERLP